MAKNLTEILNQAGALLEARDFAQATSYYREALKIKPGNAAATMGMAMIHNRTGQPEKALQALQSLWVAVSKSKAKTISTTKAAVLAQIGLAQEQLGRFSEALVSFKQAHTLLPSEQVLARIQKIENLIASPNAIEQIVHRAGQLRNSGQLDEAGKLYHAALQINPDYADALHGMGLTLRIKNDLVGALPLIQQAIIFNPERPDYYNDLGIVFQDRGEIDKAISFHKRALKVTPDFLPALINLGVAYKRKGSLDEAVATYRKVIEIKPDTPAAHNNLGNLLRIQGKFTAARKALEQALKLQPDYQDARLNLAALDQELDQEEAVSNPKMAPLNQKLT